MKFIEATDKKSWDDFVFENNGDFLQSWEWGDVQNREGGKVKRFSIYANNQHLANLSAYEFGSKIAGTYLYIPRGPVIKTGSNIQNEALVNEFTSFIKNISDKAIFVVCEPLNDLLSNTFGKPAKNRQPKKTLIIDTQKSLEAILSGVTKTRKQGIVYAEKMGILISSDNSREYLDLFWKLISKTSTRQNFGIFTKHHYENILDLMPSKIFLAKKNDQTIAGAQIIFWKDTATYLHAGSDDKKFRAPDLLIWKVIEYCNDKGIKKFDLWGIDENKWPGVTFFKKSFGGAELEYPQARILVNRPVKYLAYNLYRKIRQVV